MHCKIFLKFDKPTEKYIATRNTDRLIALRPLVGYGTVNWCSVIALINTNKKF
jgi:hypothetical protein